MFPILDSSGLTVIEIASSGSLMSMLKIHLEVNELGAQHLVTSKGTTPILTQTFPLEPGLSLFGIHQSLWQNTKRSKIRMTRSSWLNCALGMYLFTNPEVFSNIVKIGWGGVKPKLKKYRFRKGILT